MPSLSNFGNKMAESTVSKAAERSNAINPTKTPGDDAAVTQAVCAADRADVQDLLGLKPCCEVGMAPVLARWFHRLILTAVSSTFYSAGSMETSLYETGSACFLTPPL
jgi:hypothetical protein